MKLINRRAFLRLTSTWGIPSMLAAGSLSRTVRAHAQPQLPTTIRIAHLSNRHGPLAEAATYSLMGAQLGAEEAHTTAAMFGTSVELIIEDAVPPEQLRPVARKLMAQPNLAAIIGALDDAEISGLSEFTQQEGVVFFNTTARAGTLRGDKCQRSTFHVMADTAMHVHALGLWLLQSDRRGWHFVTSESQLGQEAYRWASQWFRAQGGMELGHDAIPPQDYDFAPLLERLGRQNAETIFVVLPGETLRQFLRQHTAAGVASLVAGAPLDMISMWNTPPDHVKGLWATSWYHQLERFSARELNGRFVRRFGQPMEAYAWANWAAAKLAVEGVLRTGSTEPATLVQYLEDSPAFDGHKGKALTFRAWNHQLRQPMYVLKARDPKPENPRDLFELLGEMPPPVTQGKSVADVLDTLGEPKAESRCPLAAQ